jgi:uncharacterized protein YbaP (TraB family)
MFILVTAEISNHILSTSQRHDVEDVLKTLGISAIKIEIQEIWKYHAKVQKNLKKLTKH